MKINKVTTLGGIVVVSLLFFLSYEWGKKNDVLQRADVKLFFSATLKKNDSTLRGLYNIRQPIAHGGGIGRVRWRNTEESVQESIRNGFRIIEVDMQETSDGKYVGAHDWCTFRRLTGNACLKNEPLTYESAINSEVCGCEHPLSFKFLRDVMEHNSELILEVDKIQDYDYLLKALPYPDRLMVISYNRGGVFACHAGWNSLSRLLCVGKRKYRPGGDVWVPYSWCKC